MNVDSAKSQLAHAQDHIEDVLFVINIEKPKDEELRATLVCLFLNLQALIQTQDGLISGSRAMRFFELSRSRSRRGVDLFQGEVQGLL